MPPIDWNQFDKDAQQASADATKATDDELASKISSVSRLTDQEVKSLFPTNGDAARAAKLLSIVKGATTENQKVAALKQNFDQLAGVAVRLIGHLS